MFCCVNRRVRPPDVPLPVRHVRCRRHRLCANARRRGTRARQTGLRTSRCRGVYAYEIMRRGRVSRPVAGGLCTHNYMQGRAFMPSLFRAIREPPLRNMCKTGIRRGHHYARRTGSRFWLRQNHSVATLAPGRPVAVGLCI